MRENRRIRATLMAVGLFLAGASLAAAQCEYKLFPHREIARSVGNQGHMRGKHRSKITANIRCQCETSCRSNCRITWDSPPVCEDKGRIRDLKVHRVYSAERVRSGTKPNALTGGGATCGAAFGCFVEECLPLLCSGIAITVKGEPLGVGAGVTFTGRPLALWSSDLEIPFECEECWTSREVTDDLRNLGQEYIPVDEGGYGNGHGSVYRTCWWECQSWMDSQGQFQEYCEVKECLVF